MTLSKALAKSRIDGVSLISMFRGLREFIKKNEQLCFTLLHSSKTTLFGAHEVVLLEVVQEVADDNVLKKLARYASRGDWPVA